jgi:hypothetical protein
MLRDVKSRAVPEILWLAKVVTTSQCILLVIHTWGPFVMVTSAWPAGATSKYWEPWLLGMKLIHEWLGWLLSKETSVWIMNFSRVVSLSRALARLFN